MPEVQYKQKPRDIWLQDPVLKDWLNKHQNIYITTSSAFAHKNKSNFIPVSLKTNQQEAALCLYIATQSSISPVDHLRESCANKFKDGAKANLHRTKCTNIITNVLAPNFVENLMKDRCINVN